MREVNVSIITDNIKEYQGNVHRGKSFSHR